MDFRFTGEVGVGNGYRIRVLDPGYMVKVDAPPWNQGKAYRLLGIDLGEPRWFVVEVEKAQSWPFLGATCNFIQDKYCKIVQEPSSCLMRKVDSS